MKPSIKRFLVSSSFLSIVLGCSSVFAEDFKFNVDYSGWSQFGLNIQTCTKGSFSLPDPVQIGFLKMGLEIAKNQGAKQTAPITQNDVDQAVKMATITYNIIGLEKGKCHVNIAQKAPQGNPNDKNAPLQAFELDCQFSEDKLPTLTTYAQKVSSGSFVLTHNDPVSQIMVTECKAKTPPTP